MNWLRFLLTEVKWETSPITVEMQTKHFRTTITNSKKRGKKR